MRMSIKIILFVVIFSVAILLSMLVKEAGASFIMYFIIFPAAFAAWNAVWKYNPDAKKDNSSELQKKDDDDKHILKKD